MRFLYIIRYQMSSGKFFMTAAYAVSWKEAVRTFHQFMGSRGADYDQYRIDSFNLMPESMLQFPAHMAHIRRLSPEDRQQLFEDRRTRQLKNKGRVDQFVQKYFQNPSMEFAA